MTLAFALAIAACSSSSTVRLNTPSIVMYPGATQSQVDDVRAALAHDPHVASFSQTVKRSSKGSESSVEFIVAMKSGVNSQIGIAPYARLTGVEEATVSEPRS